MKLDSKWFDHIRVKKKKGPDTAVRTHRCAVAGCDAPGLYPAPRGRNFEGQYIHFCLEHVRAYNKSYNYFSGMPDEDVAAYQADNATGHRPTWAMGRGERVAPARGQYHVNDPFEFFHESPAAKPARREVPRLQRKALETLGLEAEATKQEIRDRYKLLVKRLHPDMNGGDRTSEAKLAEIIQAYRQLRNAGIG